jgi:hypothetical protein
MKLHLRPEGRAYKMEPGSEVIRSDLDGGAGRYRRDVFGSSYYVAVNYILDPTEHDYFWAFYRTATLRGSVPFEADLLLDGSTISEYSCHFMQKPVLTEQRGLGYFIQAQLEVTKPFDDGEVAADEAIIAAYETLIGVEE